MKPLSILLLVVPLVLTACARDPKRLPAGWRIAGTDIAADLIPVEPPAALTAAANRHFRRSFRGTIYDGRSLSIERAFLAKATRNYVLEFNIEGVVDACAGYVFDAAGRRLDTYLLSC